MIGSAISDNFGSFPISIVSKEASVPGSLKMGGSLRLFDAH